MKPPACPVEEDVRCWVEARMQWLAKEFGEDRLRTVTVVTPTTEFFPDRWKGTEEEAEALAERIAGYMGLDFGEIDVYNFDNPDDEVVRRSSVAGLYREENGRYRVGYDVASLEDPLQLTATFAHEFAHVHLLGHGRASPDEEDHEQLTDLCCVFLGMGVVVANSGVYEKNLRAGHIESWRIGRLGYLDLRTFGYAFAVFAHLRREDHPEWAAHLRLDVRSTMSKGLKRLTEVGVDPLSDRSAFELPESLRPDRDLADESDEPERLPRSKRSTLILRCHYCNVRIGRHRDGDDFPTCKRCRHSIDDVHDVGSPINEGVRRFGDLYGRIIIVALITGVAVALLLMIRSWL